jgi:hypothetical protein
VAIGHEEARMSAPILPALTDDPRPGDHVETGMRENGEGAYEAWLTELDEDVIQGEFGYEPGEFTVYSSHWRELYDQGLTPREAWQRAIDGYANARAEREAEQQERWARIVSEDEAAVARYRAEHRHE